MRTEDYYPVDLDADVWLQDIPRKRSWSDGWGSTALLVLDLQRFFTDPSSHAYVPSSGTVLKRTGALLKSYDGPVIFTRHVNEPDDGCLMPVWWRDTINGEWSRIDPDIRDFGGRVLEKRDYSAFFSTGLQELLEELKVRTVVISGLLTDICCETTARDAFMRGFQVVFLADCTGTATLSRHMSSLRIISEAFGEVITSKEFLSRS